MPSIRVKYSFTITPNIDSVEYLEIGDCSVNISGGGTEFHGDLPAVSAPGRYLDISLFVIGYAGDWSLEIEFAEGEDDDFSDLPASPIEGTIENSESDSHDGSYSLD